MKFSIYNTWYSYDVNVESANVFEISMNHTTNALAKNQNHFFIEIIRRKKEIYLYLRII